MARRQLTLLIMSDDEAPIRQFRLSKELIRAGIGAALLVLALLSSLAAGFFVKQSQELRAERLAKQNALLAAEVESIRSHLQTLEGSLDQLSERDEKYRLLAGLDPIDEDVRQAGIGGPGTATLTSSSLYQLDPDQGQLAFSAAHDLNTMIRRAQLLEQSWTEATRTIESKHEEWATTPSILPANGYISSAFSPRRWHPILNRPRPHEGLDVAAPRGTPILAAADGRISYAGQRGDYGRMVEIDHGNGIVTRYAHAQVLTVRTGQRVKRGDKIAEVGETGLALGPHLHYEVLKNGRPQNPKQFVFDPARD